MLIIIDIIIIIYFLHLAIRSSSSVMLVPVCYCHQHANVVICRIMYSELHIFIDTLHLVVYFASDPFE